MFDHVTIRVSNRDASERFYTTVLAAIEIERTDGEWDDFSITGGEPTTGLHVGFRARSHEEVDHFWRTGVNAGYESDGEPGPRPEYGDAYYGGFLLDPDGNSIEACFNDSPPAHGNIDHLWIRVADLSAARRFYETLAPYTGFEFWSEPPGRVHFRDSDASFALVTDDRPPTRNLHLAFGTSTDEAVDRFHATALAAGYRDNGGPGGTAPVSRRLLRRVRARPRRSERRGREPQPPGAAPICFRP